MKLKMSASIVVVSIIIVLFATAVMAEPYTEPYSEQYSEDEVAAFPSLHINTYLDPFVQEREFWHEGTISFKGAPAEYEFEGIAARIRGRGNSTWWNGPDKRPLRFRFNVAQGMYGSDAIARDWILLANQFDRSLLRNYAAFYLGNSLSGLYWTPSPQNVHLYVNGEYMGVYLLTDERDVSTGRMPLVAHDDPTISDFFLELDARAYVDAVQNEDFIIVNNMHYDLRWPSNLPPEHVSYIYNYVNAVSYAIRYQSFDDVLSLIDFDSFVDFYIVQELFKDVDAASLSTFMYITGIGDERRLFLGPIWDYDLAAGNHSRVYSPEGLHVAIVNYWFRHLLIRPEFAEVVTNRWNEIRHVEIAQTIERVRFLATRYQYEFERNFIRHPDVMGRAQMPTPQEILEIDTFVGHVDHLINWLETRADWMDYFFNDGDSSLVLRLAIYEAFFTQVGILVDGYEYDFLMQPLMRHDTTLLSLMDIGNVFDLHVAHNPVTEIVILVSGSTSIVLCPQSITVNGERTDLDTLPMLVIDDNVFVALRVVAEALMYEVNWDDTIRTIILSRPE